MAKKKYIIQFIVDSSTAEAAVRRANAAMGQLDKTATKAAASIDKAMAALGNSANAAANAATSAANRSAAAQQAAADRAAKAAQAAADRAARAAQASAAKQAKAGQDAADKAARAHQAAQDKAAKAHTRAAAAAAKASRDQQAAADRAAKAAQAAAERTAKAQQQAADRAAKAVAQQHAAAARAQAAQDRLVTKSLTNQQVRQQAFNAKMRESNKARVDAAIATMGAERSGFLEATAGALGLETALTAVGATAAGIGILVAGVESLAESFVSAKESALEMAQKTLDTLGDLREIAAIKEKSFPTDEDLAHHSDVRTKSGLTHREAVTWRAELANTLGTVGDDKVKQEQREKLEIVGAEYAARAGGGERAISARATAMGLIPSFMKGDNLQAEDIADTATTADMILGKGAGTQMQGTQQYAKVLTSMSSGVLQGKFHNPLQAAALTALATKAGAGTAATSVEQSIRGLERSGKMTKNKGAIQSQGETIKEAGILDTDDPDQKLRKFFTYLDKNLKKDQSVDKFLQDRGFAQSGERKGLTRFYEAHTQGDYEDVMGLATKPVEKGIAEKKAKEFQGSRIGRYKIAQAKRDAATLRRGLLHSDYETGRVEAESDLTDQGVFDTGWGKVKQKLASASTFGLVEGKEVMINDQLKKNKEDQIKALGGEVSPARGGVSLTDVAGGIAGGPAGLAGLAGKYIGGNVYEHVFADKSAETTHLERIVKELEKLNDKADKQGKEVNAAAQPKNQPASGAKGPPSTIGTWQSWLGL
ncbi:hypothetical protein [Singulisphaera sp. PoT]|uniref:hypothetical protein n=1 Tax=Singulisphaera sp. PoT TaxID=3411797 RepID=UPI003BF5F6DA